MMDDLPIYVSLIFVITTLITLGLFYWVIKNSSDAIFRKKSILIIAILIVWLILQAFLGLYEVYSQNTDALPPKIFIWGLLPNIIVYILLFSTQKGKKFIDSLSLKKLTYINIVRIPVEFVLLWLFMNRIIPEIMTFEGWNFDILAGLTAPFIIYYGFTRQLLSKKVILLWNIIGLGLLLNIVGIALLSAPFPLQRLAFEQPNIGILYFPFNWLPSFIVPIVIFGHLASIRQLTKKQSK